MHRNSRRIAAWAAAALSSVLAGDLAHGAWGLKFEVWNGTAWVPSVKAPADSVVKFRFGAYFDADSAPVITTADGTGTAQALNRFTGSNRAIGFVAGDVFQNVVRTISSGNPALIQITGNRIGGTTVTSFGSQLFLADVPFENYKQIYTGEVRLGPDTSSRTIEIQNNTFGSGNTAGLTFYSSASLVNKQSAAPQAGGPARLDITATIQVTAPCPSDFNHDGLVNESDFILFVISYQHMLCSAPAMPAGCPADLNADTIVDDVDFTIFGHAYDELECP